MRPLEGCAKTTGALLPKIWSVAPLQANLVVDNKLGQLPRLIDTRKSIRIVFALIEGLRWNGRPGVSRCCIMPSGSLHVRVIIVLISPTSYPGADSPGHFLSLFPEQKGSFRGTVGTGARRTQAADPTPANRTGGARTSGATAQQSQAGAQFPAG